MWKMALKKKNCISSYIIVIPQKLKNAQKIEQKSAEIDLSDRNLHKILFLIKTKNGHILTFSGKKQISAILCFATCDWFCPMTSHMIFLI